MPIASGPLGAAARETGIRSAAGTPVIVEGRLWGMMAAGSTLEQPLPADTEARLASFTELVATAIANAESRAALARLAEEQAALRRVATLVARGAPPEEVFAAVTGEAGRLLGAHLAGMGRYESDQTMTVLAAWAAEGEQHPLVPGPWPLEGGDLASTVFQTGRSGPDRRLSRRSRAHRRVRTGRAGGRLLGRQPDSRRGAAVGRSVLPFEAGPRAVRPGH